jgi:Mg2+ and Co2+ transporter CorA
MRDENVGFIPTGIIEVSLYKAFQSYFMSFPKPAFPNPEEAIPFNAEIEKIHIYTQHKTLIEQLALLNNYCEVVKNNSKDISKAQIAEQFYSLYNQIIESYKNVALRQVFIHSDHSAQIKSLIQLFNEKRQETVELQDKIKSLEKQLAQEKRLVDYFVKLRDHESKQQEKKDAATILKEITPKVIEMFKTIDPGVDPLCGS